MIIHDKILKYVSPNSYDTESIHQTRYVLIFNSESPSNCSVPFNNMLQEATCFVTDKGCIS